MIRALSQSAHPGERSQGLGEEAVGRVAPDDGLPGGSGRRGGGGEGGEGAEGLAEEVEVGVDGEDEGEGGGGEALALDDLGVELLGAGLRGDGAGVVERGLEDPARKRSHRSSAFCAETRCFAYFLLGCP